MEKPPPASLLKLARSQSRLSFDPAALENDCEAKASPRLQLTRTHSRLSFLSRSSTNRENSNQSTTLDGDADDETASNGHQAPVKRHVQEKWAGATRWKPPIHPKTCEQMIHLSEVISSSLLFEALPKKELNHVKQAMRGPHRVLGGMDVIRQDMSVDSGEAALYIVESGKLAAYIRSGDQPHPGTQTRVYDRKGQFFGEMALVFKCPRFASVVAETESTLWSLDRDSFNHLVRDGFLSLRSRTRSCLDRCLAFGSIDQDSRKFLLDSMELRKFEPGASITTLRSQEEESETAARELFIIESGRAVSSRGKVVGPPRNHQAPENFFESSQLFGLHVGLDPLLSECNVQALVPTVCAVVHVHAIESLLEQQSLAGGALKEPWTALLSGGMPWVGIGMAATSSDVGNFRPDVAAREQLSRSASGENLATVGFFSFLFPRRACEACDCSLVCGRTCRICNSQRDDNDVEAHVYAKPVVD